MEMPLFRFATVLVRNSYAIEIEKKSSWQTRTISFELLNGKIKESSGSSGSFGSFGPGTVVRRIRRIRTFLVAVDYERISLTCSKTCATFIENVL
jgi:hypothetical protein